MNNYNYLADTQNKYKLNHLNHSHSLKFSNHSNTNTPYRYNKKTYIDENIKTENSDTNSVRNKSVYLKRGANLHNEYYTPTSPNFKLKCATCYNKDKINSKSPSKKEKDYDDEELKFNDKMNSAVYNRLNSRVKQRQLLSDRASKSISIFRNDLKDSFFSLNDTKRSMIDDRKDHVLDRAKEKYNKLDYVVSNVLSKLIPEDKPQVTKYYKSYVQNFKPNPISQQDNSILYKSYSNDLIESIKLREQNKKESKIEEKKEFKRLLDNNIREYDEKVFLRMKEMQNMRDNMIKTNKIIDQSNKNKIRIEKEKDNKIVREYHSFINTKSEVLAQNELNRKKTYTQIMMEGLSRQLKEKQSKNKNDKIKNKIDELNSTGMNLPSYNDTRNCTCNGCGNKYKRNFLS